MKPPPSGRRSHSSLVPFPKLSPLSRYTPSTIIMFCYSVTDDNLYHVMISICIVINLSKPSLVITPLSLGHSSQSVTLSTIPPLQKWHLSCFVKVYKLFAFHARVMPTVIHCTIVQPVDKKVKLRSLLSDATVRLPPKAS